MPLSEHGDIATPPLFDSGPRRDPRPKDHLEESFRFYNRVDSPFWAEVRQVLDEWFDHYPADHQGDLRNDLRSGDERKSHAAFWELLLHELYRRAGFAAEVHPELSGSLRKPDFLLRKGSAEMLLEARVVTGESDDAYRRDRRRRAIYAAIDSARPENFYVRLEILEDGDRQPRVAAITSHIREWLAGLAVDAVERAVLASNDLRDAPSTELQTQGWHLKFSAVPVRAERRGQLHGPMLGVLPAETKVFDPKTDIRRALKHKGRRYGDLSVALVVALAVEQVAVHEEDIAAALYGSEVTQLAASDPTVVVGQYRADDGYFGPRSGRRVSAVLTVETPRPWLSPRLRPRLWLNPWAAWPYAGERLWTWTTTDAETGEFQQGQATTTAAELLELPEDWPPGEPFG